MDEKSFLAKVEAAGPDEFADIVAHPDPDQERALRSHLGDARYERLHALALRTGLTRGTRRRGNVVVLHGIMGSELSLFDRAGSTTHLWVHALRIMRGRLTGLRLAADGRAEFSRDVDVRATGIMKRHYGELLLELAQEWNVRAFWYDWRKDLRLAAAQLDAQIRGWFEDDAPVHLVAHSMGGLVARTFIGTYPQRWEAMAGPDASEPGRLVMLGTPNHGSYAIPQVIAGIEPIIRKLTVLDLRNDLRSLQAVFNSFVGSYQMLPSPLRDKGVEPLYRASTYAPAPVSQAHLDTARSTHELLSGVVDGHRMRFIAGDRQPTVARISAMAALDQRSSYDYTFAGDGRVAHRLALLDGVPTFYVECSHGDLPSDPDILGSLTELLTTGTASGLSRTPAAPPAARAGGPAVDDAASPYDQQTTQDEQALSDLVSRLRPRALAGQPIRGAAAVQASRQPGGESPSPYVTHDERRAEELLTREILGTAAATTHRDRAPSAAPPRIHLAAVHGRIDGTDAIPELNAPHAPDAVAVGHYMGVKPQAAERALDLAISTVFSGGAPTSDSDLVLTQYSERGTLRGELGQPFYLPDPRCQDRLLVIAGMGVPARFGRPELTVLARELCWGLARLRKRHLATVLIGAGNGNLPVDEAVSAWIAGITSALTGSAHASGQGLHRVTFVEADGDRLREVQAAILREQEALGRSRVLDIEYDPIPEGRLAEMARVGRAHSSMPPATDPVPTRMTVGLQDGTYEFGAITSTASVPQRRIPLDPDLVQEANDELAAEWEPAMQVERGQLLGRLLVPHDLRSQLLGNEPVVLSLDATTARIHWELVAPPDSLDRDHLRGTGPEEDAGSQFLGTSRGLTRQLRTAFAPPPEPPPPPQRVLRVLVVADPAEDAPLSGAQEEGVQVADLFESYNRVQSGSGSRVEVVSLVGPRQATRTNVLRHLMLRSYDVLHFAGHCTFDPDVPSGSGWIFTKGARLTANELNRIDRVPAFVFSNACESGVTPDRTERRSAALAPSFAESFFARGVSNFVCTAWPVDDRGAQTFALTLYAGLLGLERDGEHGLLPARTRPMHEAMRAARRATADSLTGARTWGAYQHYGNPYLRLFGDPPAFDGAAAPPGEAGTDAEVQRPPDDAAEAGSPVSEG